MTTYVGFAIGAANVLFLYPNFMTPAYYGLVTFLLSAANLVWPVMAMGLHNTIIKFFSYYKNPVDKDKLLSIALIFPLIIGSVIGGIGFFSYDYILRYFEGENELVQSYAWLIFIIALVSAYFEVFFAWARVFLKSTFGNVVKEIYHRVGVSVLLLLLYFQIISLDFFIYALVAVYFSRMLIMMIYAFKIHLPTFQFQFPSNKKALIRYAGLIFIAGTVAVALFDLDKVMIEHFMPIENVSIYGIAIYIATVIHVPSKAMHQITSPITAQYLNENNTVKLKDLYQRSSVTLLVVSGLIFLLIITNIQQLYQIIPEDYHAGISIVLLISLVKLSDNLLGNNNAILFNSDHYRVVLLLGIIFVVVAFILNLVWIPTYGIYGAAYATFTAFMLYNSFKLWFVNFKFGIHPFTSKTTLVLLVILSFALAFYFWDFVFHPIINIGLKSLVLVSLYLLLVFQLKFSEDISNLLTKLKNQIKKK
ncbi:MAG: lipopolysaccharide biosynthesis protein [Bacteroidota bacterium]